VTRWVGAWAPAAAWAAVLYLLSARTSLPMPRVEGIDKVGHFFAYLILGFLSARASKRLDTSPFLAIAVGWMYGVVDELHQSTVPGRVPSFADWIADAAGVVIGVSLYLLLRRAADPGIPAPGLDGAESNR
jgi:VanZ family protein